MSLKAKAFHSLKWSILAEAASKLIGPVVFIILARILVPSDFGVVAAATVVISFSQVFWEAGLAKTLIQRQDRIEESANNVFWVNVFLAAILSVILFFAAPTISVFFKDPSIADVVRVLSLQLVVSAAGSVHTALMQRDFHFKRLFWIRLTTTTAPALASIPLAMSGWGYWSLVAGTMLGQVAQTAGVWLLSTWRPRFRFDVKLARELWQFGRWVMLSALLAWFYGWTDAIVVGHFLGTFDMGLYRTGNTFIVLLFGLIFTPLLPVLFSALSRAQDDAPKLSDAMEFVLKGTAIVVMPLALGLFAFSDVIAALVFDQDWTGIEKVISILALVHGFSWLVGANGELYRATGKPEIESIVMSIVLPIYIIGYLLSIHSGLFTFLYARLILAIFALFLHVGVLCWQLKWTLRKWLGIIRIPCLLAVTVFLSAKYFSTSQEQSISYVFLIGFAASFLYFLAVLHLEKRFWMQLSLFRTGV